MHRFNRSIWTKALTIALIMVLLTPTSLWQLSLLQCHACQSLGQGIHQRVRGCKWHSSNQRMGRTVQCHHCNPGHRFHVDRRYCRWRRGTQTDSNRHDHRRQGYYVMTFSSFLNNGGDDVRFLGTDGTTVYDAYTYTSAQPDMSWCRKPDGGSWSAVQCSPTQGATNNPPLPPGTWTPGTLEIHVLNVGQGESQLIIGPTGKTLLIDVFESNWNTNQTDLGGQRDPPHHR